MSDAGALEGAGIVDSIGTAVGHLDDPGLLAMDGVIVGLDALGVVANPLAALISGGLGWLVEHVSFLHEGLDALAGDPGAVAQVAAQWSGTVKAQIASSGTDLDAAVSALTPSWTFPAVDSYLATAGQVREFLTSLEGASDGVAQAVQVSGVLVATTRSLIRDMVTDVVGEFLAAAIAALASSWFTLGGSVAAFIGWATFRGTVVAGRITSKIAKLVDKLADVLSRFSRLAEAVRQLRVAAVRLRSLSTSLGHVASSAGASASASARTIGIYARTADEALGYGSDAITSTAGVPGVSDSQQEAQRGAGG